MLILIIVALQISVNVIIDALHVSVILISVVILSVVAPFEKADDRLSQLDFKYFQF